MVQLKQSGKTDFETRNDSQLFYAKTLSIVYAEVKQNLKTFKKYNYTGCLKININFVFSKQ